MRLTLFHNPYAGDSDHSRESLEALLRTSGHEFVYRSVKEDGWNDAPNESADLIVVAGGDGTAEKVLTALGPSPTTATILPLGSANNIATAIGLNTNDVASVVAGWESADRKPFDVWQVKWQGGRGRFLEAFGGGVFGDMFTRADAQSAESSGEDNVELGLQLVRSELERVRPQTWELEIDGTFLREELLGVELMNIGQLGPQLELAPGADPGDGVLDVVLLLPEHRDALIA